MSTNHVGAQSEAVFARLRDWAVANFDLTRVELPGTKLANQPEPSESDPAGTAWIRAQLLGAGARQITIGPHGKRQHLRLLHLDVFTPRGPGRFTAETIANQLAEQYRAQLDADGRITYGEPDCHEMDVAEEEADPWYRYAVDIPVRYQFNPDSPVVEVGYPVLTITQTAHGLAAGQAVYSNAGTWAKAISMAAATLADGIVVSAPDADTVHISVGPTARVNAHGHAIGATLWLSQSTAGALTTEPVSGLKQRVATALDANTLKLHDDIGEAS